jgi:hypothetical protein
MHLQFVKNDYIMLVYIVESEERRLKEFENNSYTCM